MSYIHCVVVRLLYYPPVTEYLANLPAALRIEVAEALDYLQTFGRAAQLPDVRPIASVPNLYETRTQTSIDGRRYTIRVLVVAHSDEVFLALVAGDKDTWTRQHPNSDWYATWLPVATQLYEHLKGRLP
jgi:phage-related protein